MSIDNRDDAKMENEGTTNAPETAQSAPESTDFSFSAEDLAQIEQMKSRYPDSQSAVMPVLWLAQKKWGWLSEGAMNTVASILDLSPAHVRGVATFYTMYWKKPMGRHHVQVCTNISCNLRGGEKIYDHLRTKLGLSHMERSDDGRFSLEEVECMGACGGAPMIAVNERYHENVTIDDVERLLDEVE